MSRKNLIECKMRHLLIDHIFFRASGPQIPSLFKPRSTSDFERQILTKIEMMTSIMGRVLKTWAENPFAVIGER